MATLHREKTGVNLKCKLHLFFSVDLNFRLQNLCHFLAQKKMSKKGTLSSCYRATSIMATFLLILPALISRDTKVIARSQASYNTAVTMKLKEQKKLDLP